jgi:hypothetical protein
MTLPTQPSFKIRALTTAMMLASALALSACNDSNDDNDTPPIANIVTGDTIALTDMGHVISFDRATPSTLKSNLIVTGLKANDVMIGMDYRPADDKLYAVSSLGNIYTLDPATGVAAFKVALSANITDTTDGNAPFSAISGDTALMSVDFNPMADKLRVISSEGLNLRIDVDTGATITDGNINGDATAKVTAAAYSNSYAGTVSTRLYDIDTANDRLYVQNANAGTLDATQMSPLGVDATGGSAFDIDGMTNQGYALLKVGSATQLYTIDLTTVGSTEPAASLVGSLPTSVTSIRGLALKPSANRGTQIYGLTANNQLIGFMDNTPNSTTTKAITGLMNGETLVGIDYRLRTSTIPSKSGTLYALSTMANLYTIDPVTGIASNKVALSANPADTTDGNAAYSALIGTHFAVDFNPTADKLRVISDSGQNLRIDVDTGATTTDIDLNGVNGAKVSAAAYINSFKGRQAIGTALYDIDSSTSNLLQQTDPNKGTLVVIGPLSVVAGMDNGMDIVGIDNRLAFASIASSTGPSTLYRVNVATGAATPAIRVDGVANVSASMIGSTGPALIDLAIKQ